MGAGEDERARAGGCMGWRVRSLEHQVDECRTNAFCICIIQIFVRKWME